MAPSQKRRALGRSCTVCSHPDKAGIELAILRKVPFRSIGLQYGMAHTSVIRHVVRHMSVVLEEAGIGALDSMLANMAYLNSQTLELLEQAKQRGSMMAAATLIASAQKNQEIIAKLTGILDDRPQINVLVLPQWAGLKDAMLRALADEPVALEKLHHALAVAQGE